LAEDLKGLIQRGHRLSNLIKLANHVR